MQLLVCGPAGTWNVFLASGDQKKSELFEMHTCLWPDSQILFRLKRKKLATASLLFFFSLTGIVASVVGMSFCHLCCRFKVEVFSYCSFTETLALGFQNWFDHACVFLEFFLEYVSSLEFLSALTGTCMNCSIVFSFLTTWKKFES